MQESGQNPCKMQDSCKILVNFARCQQDHYKILQESYARTLQDLARKLCMGSQCALRMGLANVPWEWDYPMCLGNGTIQCALGMGLVNVHWE